jgi:VanZ family protein
LPVLPARVRWALVFAVAVAVLLASVVDTGGAASWGPFGLVRSDKYVHALGYAGLAVAVAYAMAHRGSDLAVVAVAFSVAVAYGLGIELLQSGLAHRSASLADAAANATGAALAVGVWRVLVRRVRLRATPRAEPRGAIAPAAGSDPETRD